MSNDTISDLLKTIVSNLEKKDFETVYKNDFKKALSVEEIREAINEYKGTLTEAPSAAYDTMDLYRISESEVSVDFDLWYDHKKSDLTLSCNFKEIGDKVIYSIEGIHVL